VSARVSASDCEPVAATTGTHRRGLIATSTSRLRSSIVSVEGWRWCRSPKSHACRARSVASPDAHRRRLPPR
jgi:hypothetical protein